jgi:hypothetical protein
MDSMPCPAHKDAAVYLTKLLHKKCGELKQSIGDATPVRGSISRGGDATKERSKSAGDGPTRHHEWTGVDEESEETVTEDTDGPAMQRLRAELDEATQIGAYWRDQAASLQLRLASMEAERECQSGEPPHKMQRANDDDEVVYMRTHAREQSQQISYLLQQLARKDEQCALDVQAMKAECALRLAQENPVQGMHTAKTAPPSLKVACDKFSRSHDPKH